MLLVFFLLRLSVEDGEEIGLDDIDLDEDVEKNKDNLSNERKDLNNLPKSIDSDIKKGTEANKQFEGDGTTKEINNIKRESDNSTYIRTSPPKKIPITHYVTPEVLPESGRVNFTIHVTNVKAGICYAKVDGNTVEGSIDENGDAVFKAPPHRVGLVPVKFSKDRIKWYGQLEVEYVPDKKAKRNVLYSIIIGLLLASALSIGLFYFITGGKKPTPENQSLIKPSRLRSKDTFDRATKKRTVASVA